MTWSKFNQHLECWLYQTYQPLVWTSCQQDIYENRIMLLVYESIHLESQNYRIWQLEEHLFDI